jgi:hypothetical protein
MKGDFSRIRFNPRKEYAAVLKQQGRVDLDSDANEQCAIDLYRTAKTNVDVIGKFGGPVGDAGFAITIDGDEILIGPGRYYVEGILVENHDSISYDQQPHLLNPALSAQALLDQVVQDQASLQFVLEVWQRLVTDLDDSCLVEPALGQADTTVRLQTVWRVVGSVAPTYTVTQDPASGPVSLLTPCCQTLYELPLDELRDGAMGASTAATGDDCGCQPIAAAGYQGLENQLYRVEIHTPGDLGTATFKWSRENGSVVAKVTGVGYNSPVITVGSLGPDANLGFQNGQWVELSDDTNQFGEPANQSGTLYQILTVNQATLQVTMTTPVTGLDTSKNARMRRWDQTGASATADGVVLSSAAVPLENGIEVSFRKGGFQSGDYWTIPARTANGQIDWPPCGGSGNYFQPSQHIRISRAPLACVQLRFRRGFFESESDLNHVGETSIGIATDTGLQETNVGIIGFSPYEVNDCRLLFPPLTDVNADTAADALHVTAITWTNDDVMTVDTLLENGFSVTFDQATTCPWGGGNFKVTLELPYLIGETLAVLEGLVPGITKPTFGSPPGTDCFLRTVMALDPPWGITVNGTTVSWITAITPAGAAGGQTNYGAYEVLALLNTLLGGTAPIGLGRVRVKLIGGAIYGDGDNGNIYLDGASFGETGTRSLDGSESVNYNLPSGNATNVSDYDGWFYLAPTVLIKSVVIQGVENGVEKPVSALKVLVDSNNQVIGYQVGETASVPVTGLEAVITLSYPPIAPVVLTLTFNPGGGIVNIISSVTIPAGQVSYTAAISIPVNPGQVTDTFTLIASVSTAVGPISFTPAPTLAVTGMAIPPPPIQ